MTIENDLTFCSKKEQEAFETYEKRIHERAEYVRAKQRNKEEVEILGKRNR